MHHCIVCPALLSTGNCLHGLHNLYDTAGQTMVWNSVSTQVLPLRRSSRTVSSNTELWLARSLAIGSEHTVIRCRLDFLTNRQLRKLRTLAELRLAAVSSLQHCAITLVRLLPPL